MQPEELRAVKCDKVWTEMGSAANSSDLHEAVQGEDGESKGDDPCG